MKKNKKKKQKEIKRNIMNAHMLMSIYLTINYINKLYIYIYIYIYTSQGVSPLNGGKPKKRVKKEHPNAQTSEEEVKRELIRT